MTESGSLEGDENTAPPQSAECEDTTALKLHFPLSKVKRIGKLVAPSCNISAEAAQLLALGAEEYVRLLGKAAYKFSQLESRKTVQLKDIERCIERDWLFSILEDAIEDWPESQGGPLRTAPADRTLLSVRKGKRGAAPSDDSFVQTDDAEESDVVINETGDSEDDNHDDELADDDNADESDDDNYVGDEEEEENEITNELTDGYMDVEENVDEDDLRSRSPTSSNSGAPKTSNARSPGTREIRDIEDF